LTPGQLEKIHGLLYGTLPVFGRHPWQLMLFNLARLLTRGGQRPAVAVCLDKMAAVCQAGRETMQSMGLLAFSSLHVQGLAEKHHYRAAKQLLDKMRQSRYLDQAHFAPLYRPASLEERLRTVADGRKRFFPFTYR
jgi:hypothetical protein